VISEITSDFERRRFICVDPVGLHARPATVFVNTACKCLGDVELVKNGKQVNAKSILGVLSLGVSEGDEFEVWCQGTSYKDDLKKIEDVLLNQKIAELEDMEKTNIDEAVEASYNYLKRFDNDDFVDIISGICHRFAKEYDLDLNIIKEKL